MHRHAVALAGDPLPIISAAGRRETGEFQKQRDQMILTSSANDFDSALLVRTMRASLAVESHLSLLLWLQGDVRRMIPHDVMFSCNGSLGSEGLHYDIVSAIPGLRTSLVPPQTLQIIGKRMHEDWVAAANSAGPAALGRDFPRYLAGTEPHVALATMRHALCHAISDTRVRVDHLYILLRQRQPFSEERRLFELLLPHVDAAVSKIEALPNQARARAGQPATFDSFGVNSLSNREREILEWVRCGKTNIEIGMILGISGFTVKNHLKSIFQKINVSNRAQAVGKLDTLNTSGSRALAAG